ncbi:hypothetical protein RSM41_002903 [Klebsiella aerogenes]|uniref:hypothetical protein n=1 Tax=Klebsiella aerogenes TaxID=548 RepID=UPI00044E1167|nr:hypothetical protein [Klebsiella aerogenes]AMQ58874.1 hypothetical protein AL497_03660 [Klebsiella aerogenes]EKY0564459.1 hypothetical protein [Klebsiella aerogenes]ELA1600777.1 hypothetical protein [Klebsiella aerogenes]ELA1744686.1 hypothetical protein [Klebsiella aerogenes]ELB6541946.1 hypothetical protein [Klebsiella aerogenes]
MKTPLPIEMLEDVSAEIIENTSLLEVIYRTADMDPEVDNSVACLIRSMQKTLEKAHGYIEMLASNPAPPKQGKDESDIADDVFDVVVTAKKLEELAHIYTENYFTDADSDNPACHMAAVIYDYSIEVCKEIQNIESKLA